MTQEIIIELKGLQLRGILTVPKGVESIVIFAHGSGSGRYRKRNQYVASVLNQANMATLLFDLLTPEEESIDEDTREYRFNIPLLAERLVLVKEWLLSEPEYSHFAVGFFGASTGAAAALIAAAKSPKSIKAVVSRGGRPDLAEDYLARVKAPTLLIIGGEDDEVIKLNEYAYQQLKGEKLMQIIPGASHLFEEPGTLEQAAACAGKWFSKYLIATD